MYRTANRPRLEQEGVTFYVAVGFAERECVVSRNALSHLRRKRGGSLDYMQIYRACEDQIHSVARRLAIAGGGQRLVLGASNFI